MLLLLLLLLDHSEYLTDKLGVYRATLQQNRNFKILPRIYLEFDEFQISLKRYFAFSSY